MSDFINSSYIKVLQNRPKILVLDLKGRPQATKRPNIALTDLKLTANPQRDNGEFTEYEGVLRMQNLTYWKQKYHLHLESPLKASNFVEN